MSTCVHNERSLLIFVCFRYGATKLYLEGAAEAFARSVDGCDVVIMRFAWCPFAKEDVEAMANCKTIGAGPDEYMSPGDCSRCVHASLTSDLQGSIKGVGSSLPQHNLVKLFCQSKPPKGRPFRFDIEPTCRLLDWKPRDSYPDGIDWILRQTDYVKNRQLKARVVIS